MVSFSEPRVNQTLFLRSIDYEQSLFFQPGTEREGAFLHKLPNRAIGVLDWIGFVWYIVFSNKSLRAARIHS